MIAFAEKTRSSPELLCLVMSDTIIVWNDNISKHIEYDWNSNIRLLSGKRFFFPEIISSEFVTRIGGPSKYLNL